MAHTTAWNEASPAGTDLASTIDNSMRAMKLDVRERMAVDHIWGVSLDDDGKHKRVGLVAAPDTVPIQTLVPNVMTTPTGGAGLIDLKQTWNTPAILSAIRTDITNMQSGAGSLLMDLKVNGITMFGVDMAGNFTIGGGGGTGGGTGGGQTGVITVPTTFTAYVHMAAGATVSGDLTVNGNIIGNNGNIYIRNPSAASDATIGVFMGNNIGYNGQIIFCSSNHVSHPDQLIFRSNGTGGMRIDTLQWAPIVIWAGGAEVMRLHQGGGVSIGTAEYPGAGNLLVQGTIVARGDVNFAGVVNVASAAGSPVGGSIAGRMFMGTSGVAIYFGRGAPTITAWTGSIYLRSDSTGPNNRFYVSTQNNTWATITASA